MNSSFCSTSAAVDPEAGSHREQTPRKSFPDTLHREEVPVAHNQSVLEETPATDRYRDPGRYAGEIPVQNPQSCPRKWRCL